MKIILKILKKITFLFYCLISQINFHFNFKLIDSLLSPIRKWLLIISGAKIGINSSIHPKVMILKPENLFIGDNSNIGSNSEIHNDAKFVIGDNVDIGTQFYINTNNHITDDPNKPLAYQGAVAKEVIIGSDIWIGARVTVLSDVKIENRIIIGAGTLVNKNLKSGYLYVGNPAKPKKNLIT